MSKKQKFLPTDGETMDAPAVSTATEAVEATEKPASNLPPRKPGLVAEINGVSYKFDRRQFLPKRALKAVEGDIQIEMDGQLSPAWITSNKAWAMDDTKFIDYIWFNVPGEVEPQAGFITLDYAVDAKTFANAKVSISQGTTDRANPERLGKIDPETGKPADAKRVEAFQAAVARKKMGLPAEAPTEQSAEAPTEQPTEQ